MGVPREDRATTATREAWYTSTESNGTAPAASVASNMTEEPKQPTIEELQQQLLELREAQEAQKTSMDNQAAELKKAQEDLAAARKLNARLMAGTDVPQQGEPEKDPLEGMTPEEALIAVIPEVVDRVDASMNKKKE